MIRCLGGWGVAVEWTERIWVCLKLRSGVGLVVDVNVRLAALARTGRRVLNDSLEMRVIGKETKMRDETIEDTRKRR